MSYQEPIYNQNGNGERNQTVPVVNTSSDICVFAMPFFTMSGASKIDCTGTTLTSGSTNVYLITGQTSVDVGFTFTANTTSLTGSTFRYEVYKYNHDLSMFTDPSVYQSSGYTWDSFSATSAFTTSIPVGNLNIDGDYLVKGYYIHDVCTEFASLMGLSYSTALHKRGDEYGLYQEDRDSYFVALTGADEPLIGGDGPTETKPIGSLVTHSYILDGTETVIALPQTTIGSSYMLALNGLTLSEGYDYTLSANSLTSYATLSGGTVSGDIFTYLYVSSVNDNALRYDSIEVTSIASGTTGNEGTNNVYYNTTQSKYEIYTSMVPINPHDMVVTLNGVTLAHGIDYYQSTTNPNRIILEGILVLSDLVTIYYMTGIGNQGNTTSTELNLSWGIANIPQTTDGLFTVELSNSSSFSAITSSATSIYVVGQVSYATTMPLSGAVGESVYYRIKNDKNYTDLCGDKILTTAYSDIIEITIQTNASNSY